MMLEHLTNGLIPAGIHRVVAAEDQSGDRHSVVQFAHPTPWMILSPLPTCITPDSPLRYPSVAASEALAKVVWEINLVEDGHRVSGEPHSPCSGMGSGEDLTSEELSAIAEGDTSIAGSAGGDTSIAGSAGGDTSIARGDENP